MRSTRILSGPVTVVLCVAMLVVLGVAGVSPALALDSTTSGTAPLWFQFNVGSIGPNDNTSHVSVTLRSQAACSGGFHIFSSGDWGYWDMPTEDDWMGAATDIGYDMYMWAGELVPGAYYPRLGYGAKPGCVLGVSGQAVDYLGLVDLGWHLAEAETPAAAPHHIVTTAPTIAGADFRLVAAESAGTISEPSSPTPALVAASPAAAQADFIQVGTAAVAHDMHEMEMTPSVWMPVTSNEPMMFHFFVGNVPEEQDSHVSVTVYGAPFRSGRFQIFTAEGLPFHTPAQDDWFGQAIMEDGEHATWTGDLTPGAYYVLVYPEGMKNCLLAVSGASVSF